MTFIRRRNSSLGRIYNDMINLIINVYIQVHTLSKSRMFQMVTMSLCIANKHFSRLTLRKWMPDAIARQYSVNCRKDARCRRQARGPTYSSFLLCDDTSGQVDIPTEKRAAYFIDAVILAGISTPCAVARTISAASDRSSSCPAD